MAAAIESLFVVLLGLLGVGYFIHSLMAGTASLLTVAGGLGALAVAWATGSCGPIDQVRRPPLGAAGASASQIFLRINIVECPLVLG